MWRSLFFEPHVHGPLLFLAGAIASGLNAVGGGGSLVTFPTLVALGIPDLVANATNALALCPGSLGSAVGFRHVLRGAKRELLLLTFPSIAGAALGAFLLLWGKERVFAWAVPVLVFVATFLLAFGPTVRRKLSHIRIPRWLFVLLQFLIAVYGGYFGAGMGMLMLANFAMLREGNLHAHNAAKAWLGLFINLVASLILLAHGVVDVRAAGWVASGALLGGYVAARIFVQISEKRLRLLIAGLGFLLGSWFFLRSLGV
ncbi:MAG TPA: sulfite exporter TauE/SafE family protein [Pseudomonadota bacterium]|jgi:uncharacterized membrane protein YfcA|nr:sulfite exporter TauE/SafE family protein [Pseudomonadota bacterium]